MAITERGIGLVERCIAHLKKRSAAPSVGASRAALDALESRLMVELPPTLRRFLEFDFTFASFGPKFHGKARFGANAKSPEPRRTSVRKLAEARTEYGWTDSRLRKRVVRIPNAKGHAWNALYLGEARRDGELVILGIDNEETNVRVYPRYTAFDVYLAEQTGLLRVNESDRLDDLESHIALNPELAGVEDDDGDDVDY